MTLLSSYSLWLMPSGKINDELSEMIFQLSQSCAGPIFPPHVTLLGNLNGSEQELSNQTQILAGFIRPFQVTLTTVETLDEYFRCLFLLAEETPELLEADRLARNLFYREQDPKFLPHLSLLYGNYEPSTKEKIIAAIGREFNRSFSVSQIHLFSTTGEPKDWFRLQKFTLQGRQESLND